MSFFQDFESDSQSLLQTEYRQENVLFTVIADSGPSVESGSSKTHKSGYNIAFISIGLCDKIMNNLKLQRTALIPFPMLHQAQQANLRVLWISLPMP